VPSSCKRVDEGEYSGGDVGDMDFQELIKFMSRINS